jgi:hypothetical protein
MRNYFLQKQEVKKMRSLVNVEIPSLKNRSFGFASG